MESRVAVHYRGVEVGAVDGLGGTTLARVYNINGNSDAVCRIASGKEIENN